MNEEPKLELTWTKRKGRGQPEPFLKFEVFDKAKGADITYA